MQLYARRRHAAVLQRCRRALLVFFLAAALLLLLVVFLPSGGPPLSFAALPQLALSPARALLVPPRRLHLRLGAVAERRSATPPPPTPPEDQSEAVLMPDWEVLVLLRAGAGAGEEKKATFCAFRGGATSPARALGKLTPSGRHAYVCVLPEKARRRRKLTAPRLVFSGSGHGEAARSLPEPEKEKEMVRWSGRLVYSSAVVHNDDDDQDGVLVFAKGVNPRQGVNRAASDITCVYYHRRRRAGVGDEDEDVVVASLPAATSAQQVFRCPPPPPAASSSSSSSTSQELRVTLAIAGEETPIPSLAIYTPSPPTIGDSLTVPEKKEKKLICACTMVRDVAKFLGEWVAYHAAVGVDRFFVYDNGSEDDLSDRVRRLNEAGYDVSTVAWPWAKAQEAGFSHAAAEHRDSCEWMAFVDVDEFIFSPRWVESKKPAKSMLRPVVSVQADVGQVSLGCADFGPSGRTANPKEGVTQGYTCRKRTEERHKSLVRLDAVDRSLVNSVHHFMLRPGFRGEWNRRVRVNHYKYQAWEEFKVKFRRRVSTYVADWTDPVNLQSKDRTPGLGFEAVEPVGWTQKFCEVNDTLLGDATRRWFGVGFGNKLVRPQTHSSS